MSLHAATERAPSLYSVIQTVRVRRSTLFDMHIILQWTMNFIDGISDNYSYLHTNWKLAKLLLFVALLVNEQ